MAVRAWLFDEEHARLGEFASEGDPCEIQGLGHLGTGNSDVGGKPEKLAVEVQTFMKKSLKTLGRSASELGGTFGFG